MRGIEIEEARRQRRGKRGGDGKRRKETVREWGRTPDTLRVAIGRFRKR